MHGTLMDNIRDTTDVLLESEQHNTYLMLFIFMVFLILSGITVMNMLIGVVCEVISAVAANEKENCARELVQQTLLVMLKKLDEDGSGEISQHELQHVCEDQDSLKVLEALQVDSANFMERMDM